MDTKMTFSRDEDLRIAADAVRWQQALVQANGAPDEAQLRAAFAAWVKISPRHLREYLLAEALDSATEQFDAQRRFDVAALLEAGRGNVVSLMDEVEPAALAVLPTAVPAARTAQPRLSPWFALAASVALLCGLALALGLSGIWPFAQLGGWAQYRTDIGEQRMVELADGSIVYLNAQSTVRVRFGAAARELRLLEGEALFQVARDARRAFTVQTGATVIHALGTQFNVNRRPSDTTVVVLEGRVEIFNAANGATPAAGAARAALLGAGDAARIAARNGSVTLGTADVANTATWRQRRLVFTEDTLENIATEFNRYNRRTKIEVSGIAGSKRYGGTFDADDPEALIRFLRRDQRLVIEKQTQGYVIRERE
jgi:transmembrane sensor